MVDSVALFYLNSSSLYSSYSLALYVQGTGLTTGDTYRDLAHMDTVSTMVHLGDSIGELTAVIYVVNNLGTAVDSLVYNVPFKWVATGGGFVCDCTPPACELIGNGSFENNTSPPSGHGQVGTNVHCWNKVLAGAGACTPIELNNLCTNHNGTPDYFHPGSSSPNFSAPFNNNAISFGQVPAFNGSAYVGIAAAHSINQTNYFSEYLTQPLSSQIIAGNTYTLTFQLYLSRYSDRAVIPGVVLSNAPLCQNNYSFIPQTAFPNPSQYLTSIPDPSTGYLITTGLWHQVTITFTATSNFNTITIGHFSPPPIWINNTTAWATPNQVQPPSGFNIRCYWFIDDVSLQAILPSEIVFDVEDASCHGADDGSITITLDPPLIGHDIIWEPTVTGQGTGTATGLGPGQYSVTVVHPTGCATAETEITEPPAISATLSNAPYCPNRGVWLTSLQDAVFPVTLDWQPSQYLQDNTALFAEIDHGNPPPGPFQTFTLNITDANGCTGQFQTNIGIGGCCFGPVTYDEFQQPTDHTTFNGTNDLASDWGATLSPTALGVSSFAINGTFTVDEDLTIEDMDIILGPLAQIVIAPDKELTVNNSHLYPCNAFWNRIEVGADAALVIENGSIIEQAWFAVHAHHGGTYDISYSTFDRNLIHMKVNDYANGENPGTLEGNLFDCSAPLPSGMPDRTAIGMLINDVHSMTIGTLGTVGSSVANTFRHARFGIRSINAALEVVTCTFDDIEMIDDGNGSLHFSGFGIHAVGSASLALEVDKNNWFKNSSYGALGAGFGTMVVSGNLFENIAVTNEATNAPESFGYAIRSHANGGGSIHDNTLVDCEMGMYVLQQAPGTYQARSNRIEQSSNNTYTEGIGIMVSGSGTIDVYDHNEQAMAGQQDAYIHGMRYGILAISADEAHIHGNDIEVNPDATGFSSGIASVSSHLPKTNLNEIVNPGTWQDLTIGIYSVNSSVQTACNRVVDATMGFTVQGPDPGYKWWHNTLEGTQLVSLFGTGTAFPQQGTADYPPDNQWVDGSSFGFHTYNQNPSGLAGAIYVRPLPSNPSAADYEYQPDPFLSGNNGSGIFIEINDASTNYNPANSCGWDYRGMAMIHGVAMDTITYLGDTVSARMWSRWILYKAAQKDSSLQADSIVMAFVDTMRTTVLGKLDSLDIQMLWGMDSTAAKLLSDANTKITTTDSVGSLWKEVNSIALLKVLQLDTAYSGTDLTKLESISALCPDKYGPAVYKARDLLTSIDARPRLFLNACEEFDIPQMPSQRLADPNAEEEEMETTGESRIQIYPNPSNGLLMINVMVSVENERAMTFRLMDLSGKIVQLSHLFVGTNQVQLAVAPGSYLYSIVAPTGVSLKHGKVVIVK